MVRLIFGRGEQALQILGLELIRQTGLDWLVLAVIPQATRYHNKHFLLEQPQWLALKGNSFFVLQLQQ